MPEVFENNVISVPFIAMRGPVPFPSMLLTFDVERKLSIEAIKEANRKDRTIFLLSQRDISIDIPEEKDLYRVGTVCRIRQQLSGPGGHTYRLMVEGLYRASVVELDIKGSSASIQCVADSSERISEAKKEALIRNCMNLYEEYLNLTGDYTPEHLLGLLSSPEASHVADFIANNVNFALEDKQQLIEELRPGKRLEMLGKILNRELDVLTLEKELNDAASEAMSQNQKEYLLREEMKAIQKELGEDDDDLDSLKEKVNGLSAPKEIKEKLLKEINRLSKQPFGSSEASVIRSYIETCLELPWGKVTKETLDIEKAQKMLDKDHYGLAKVKERVIEYLAVRQLAPEIKGGLICLVGPPGTGKTSIAMSIAKATNRKLVRISLGGVHDEAEIRGHRKTYVGAMPGRIVNGLIQAGSCNPLMVLDEIDKLGSDYRGDPSAALLETLDPEQNSSFRDNFLELPFDLSQVFFITTANTTETIPRALLDRMEVIELSSYTDEEKVQIAKKHLLPKQRKKHGLEASQLKVNDILLRKIIASYTKESGVRVLEREIARLCRKAAAGIASEKFASLTVTEANLESLLGPEKIKPDEKRMNDAIGLVRGLAYTEVGGEVLDCEAAVCDGTGKVEITGNLGTVMNESVKAAITCVRTRAAELGIDPDFYKTKDIHIHFPDGAIPKDGPSAGVTICTTIASALSGRSVRHEVAMTGEITLRGRVLAIGGLREKTMGALRAGVRTVIVPEENRMDLEEIDPLVREKLSFVFAETIDDVFAAALSPINEERQQAPKLSSFIPPMPDKLTIRQ